MTGRNHDVDPLIELLGDRTRLNLPAPPVPAAAPAPPRASRRNRRRHVELTEEPGDAHFDEVFPCPVCGAPGQLDTREGASGRCYLSCNSCFKMWQEVREPDKSWQMADEARWQLR